jgi:DNA polymerase III alpha subunit
MKTVLKDRTLWYDGTSEVNADNVPSLILSGLPIDKISIVTETDDIKLFNSLADESICLNKSANNEFNRSWNIPKSYETLEIDSFVDQKMQEFFKKKNISVLKQTEYAARVVEELKQINGRDIVMIFRTIIYAVDKLKQSNTLWGVGRGSSCASLVLFLIGLHAVDPIKYSISMDEFFHD